MKMKMEMEMEMEMKWRLESNPKISSQARFLHNCFHDDLGFWCIFFSDFNLKFLSTIELDRFHGPSGEFEFVEIFDFIFAPIFFLFSVQGASRQWGRKLEERKMKKEVLIHIFHQYPQMSLRWWGSRSAIPTINAKSFFFQFAPNLAHENSIQFKLGFLFDQ